MFLKHFASDCWWTSLNSFLQMLRISDFVCVWMKIFLQIPTQKIQWWEFWTSWEPWNWSASSNLLIRKSHVKGIFCPSWLKWVVALSCWNKILSYTSLLSVCGKTSTCDISRSMFAILVFSAQQKVPVTWSCIMTKFGKHAIWALCARNFWIVILYITSCNLRWTVDLLWLMTQEPWVFSIIFWYAQTSRWFAVLYTIMFLKLVTWGSNHFADRIPFMCMMEIMLHCYIGFAFGQPNDTL